MPKGGRQPGAGRPKGKKSPATLERERTLAEVRQRIARKADDLLNAELIEGLGSNVIMKLVDPEKGKYEIVTDEQEIVRVIQEHKGANGAVGGDFYIITARPGNYKSRQYLFDRAFGKPPQTVEVKDDPRIHDLKARIQARANEKGVTYEAELALWNEKYSDNVAPEIKTKLLTEIVQ